MCPQGLPLPPPSCPFQTSSRPLLPGLARPYRWRGSVLPVPGQEGVAPRPGTCHVALPQEEEAIVELSPRSFHLFPGAGCKFHLGPQIQALSRLVTCLDLTHFRPCLPARGPWQLLSDAA